MMFNPHYAGHALFIMQMLVSLFLAILFLQSGIDKLIDRRGNIDFLKSHFAKSPLAGFVQIMFVAITVLELAAGILSALGCIVILISGATGIAFYGAVFAGVAISGLFFGQRLARDYPGAATLVSYFLVALAAIYLLGQS